MTSFTQDRLAAASPIPVTEVKPVWVPCDLGPTSLFDAFTHLGLKFGGVACVIGTQSCYTVFLRALDDLPQNIGLAYTICGDFGDEWMMVAPDGRAIFSPGA